MTADLPAQAGELTPETRRALVAILLRAARRGRELRQAQETAVNADPGRDTAVAAHIVSTPQDGTHEESVTMGSPGDIFF